MLRAIICDVTFVMRRRIDAFGGTRGGGSKAARGSNRTRDLDLVESRRRLSGRDVRHRIET